MQVMLMSIFCSLLRSLAALPSTVLETVTISTAERSVAESDDNCLALSSGTVPKLYICVLARADVVIVHVAKVPSSQGFEHRDWV